MTLKHLSGYTVRPATLEDLASVTASLNATAQAIYGQDTFTDTYVRGMWSSPFLNLETDTLVVLGKDQKTVAGYAHVLVEIPSVVEMFVRIHPNHQGNGIEACLMEWTEARAREAIVQCEPDARVIVVTVISAEDQRGDAMLREHGYRPRRHTQRMRIDMPAAPEAPDMPQGFSLRTYRGSEDLKIIHHTDQEAFRDHWGFIEVPEDEALKFWQHLIESDPQFDPALWLLAVHDASSEIAGICLNRMWAGDDPDFGYVMILGVLRKYRKRGLATTLLKHSFKALYERGKHTVTLGVDSDSLTGAVRLYENVGMHVYRRRVVYEKELRPGVDLMTRELESDET